MSIDRRRCLARLSLTMMAGALPGLAVADNKPPQRIVSVGGALTEMVYALDAQAALVGADTTSLYPEAALKLPRVGYARSLSAEGVLSLNPTLLIASEDAGPPQVIRQISGTGVEVAILPANHRFEGMLDRLQRVGQLTRRDDAAAALATHLRTEWHALQAGLVRRRTTPAQLPLRVLFVLSHTLGQAMVAGSETAAQSMIAYAGAVNAISGITGYKPLTPEAAIAARPDVILATEQGVQATGSIDALIALPGLRDTPAGRARRVVAMEAMWLLGFGPRLPSAVRRLDVALHVALPT